VPGFDDKAKCQPTYYQVILPHSAPACVPLDSDMCSVLNVASPAATDVYVGMHYMMRALHGVQGESLVAPHSPGSVSLSSLMLLMYVLVHCALSALLRYYWCVCQY
jgi:hypothetical protein